MISTWKTYTNHRLLCKLAFLCRLASITARISGIAIPSRACNIIVIVKELPRLSLVWTSSCCEVSEICLQCQGTKGLIDQTCGLSDKDWTLSTDDIASRTQSKCLQTLQPRMTLGY
ncbi:hypothetical protein CY34DRAFT_385110 [Suillus luteus UH-Slu-Lm8-n1]|uniref:Uncharacterized protein n=1 Tax=Suillus luteus UH-Slu-Lm8-n1 TaxID=930992 RepID=A0A0D0AW44_9AGAM|nr:hypothetical protein CY34DRAFT_385110 [Suillus luteus UH-Slu-Lm8-n1]